MKYITTLILLFTFAVQPVWAQRARNLEQAIQYVKLANTLREVNKSQASIDLLERALPAVRYNRYWSAVTNELLGLCYRDLDESKQALQYLQRARSQYADLKYVASAWAVNEVVRDISGKNLYAGIQIGTADVKLAIFKTQYESDFYEKDIKTIIDVPDVTLVADASNTLRGGQEVLRACLDSIQRYNIPNERVFVVFSNEVREGMVRNPALKNRLYDQLSQVLPSNAIRIDTTLTARREAELFTVGAIPRKVWPTTSALNIGSTSTIGGYFDDKKQFHPVQLSLGTDALVRQIEGKRSMGIDAFKREAQRVAKAMTDTLIKPRLNASGRGLQQRRTVGLGGDIAWALVTYLHPERAGLNAVPITMDDVDRFKRLALTDYRILTQPELSVITDPATRAKAEADLNTMQNRFGEKQLIAGALLLEAVMSGYQADSSPKRFVFIRDADISWVTGKFLETINYEYESTIAKGALYTR